MFSLRRFLIFVSVLMALSIALAACGDDDDDDDTGDTGTEATTTATTDSGDSDATEDEGDTDATEEEGDTGATEEEGDAGATEEEGDADATEDEGDTAATEEEGDTGATEEEGDTGDSGEVTYDGTIMFGDYGWDSAIVHNRVAQYILEHGWGIESDSVAGETITLFQGLVNRDIDVSMEIWVEQQPEFASEVEAGSILDLGPNYPNSIQGWWVPTYMIEGDEERGIEPTLDGPLSIEDLQDPAIMELFQDPEDPDKGRFYDCIAGWECQRVNESKFEFYGLNEQYNRFQPGSGAALATSLVSAYENGEPWFGYYWAPTWIFAVVDLTMVEEPEYTDECWEQIQDEEGNPTGEAGCAYPSVRVNKSVNAEFAEEAPQPILDFLEAYTTTMEENNEFLLYMNENEIEDHEVAAIWFLQNNPQWQDWVPEDVAERVQEQLDTESIP